MTRNPMLRAAAPTLSATACFPDSEPLTAAEMSITGTGLPSNFISTLRGLADQSCQNGFRGCWRCHSCSTWNFLASKEKTEGDRSEDTQQHATVCEWSQSVWNMREKTLRHARYEADGETGCDNQHLIARFVETSGGQRSDAGDRNHAKENKRRSSQDTGRDGRDQGRDLRQKRQRHHDDGRTDAYK